MLSFGVLTPIDVTCAPNSVFRPQDPRPLTEKAHQLTVKALDSIAFHGDYDSAIVFYEAALEEMPGDQGIMIVLARTQYEREKQSGLIKPQPNSKAAILLDALQSGRGDWHSSIRYLEEAIRDEQDEDRLMATRDALVEIEGIWDIQKIGILESFFDEIDEHPNAKILRIAFKQLDEGYFDDAMSSFEGALRLNPGDRRIKEMMAYVSGLQYNRYENLRIWVENQKSLNGKFRADALQREKDALYALAQSQKALRLSQEYEDSEAASISQKAIDLAQQAIAMARAMLSGADARYEAAKNAQSVKGSSGAASRVKGDVRIKRNQGWISFDANKPLMPGDQIRTGEESSAELILVDGSTINLGANSSIMVAAQHRKTSIYEKISGVIRAQIACVRQYGMPCRKLCYRVSTNVVCVRGTELEIVVDTGGAAIITVLKGSIEIVKETGEEPVEISAGQQVNISISGRVKSVSSVDISTMERWWEQP